MEEEQTLCLFMFNEWKHGLKLLFSISNYACISVERESERDEKIMKSYGMMK